MKFATDTENNDFYKIKSILNDQNSNPSNFIIVVQKQATTDANNEFGTANYIRHLHIPAVFKCRESDQKMIVTQTDTVDTP